MPSQRSLGQITDSLTKLSNRLTPATFVFDFLECFGFPKATIARLKSGNLNLAKSDGAVLLKDKIYFEAVPATAKGGATRAAEAPSTAWGNRANRSGDGHARPASAPPRTPADALSAAKLDRTVSANRPRFLVTTDFRTVVAYDTKLHETTEFAIGDLHEKYTFFLPLAGMERAAVQPELEADVRAAEHMAKLYNLIRADNRPKTAEDRHGLNVFLTRLLFCYFAEDTGIFPKAAFTSALKQYTQDDGSDVSAFVADLFLHLNTVYGGTSKAPKAKAHLREFPYVNGGLFSDTRHASATVPRFTAKSRRQLIELGDKDWNGINPDIFGSMFQAVVDDEKRGELGMHYTSVPNIMKVIGPLFLDDLNEEFEKARGSKAKLEKLLQRLPRLRLFDPACGCGNFLIIAYKELRKLEMRVFTELLRADGQLPLALCSINVNQFYGIEIDDFACEVAVLGLWLAEHQMNIEFQSTFGKKLPSLPLKDGARITCDNATRVDWETVCPKDKGYEVFVMGNPPYLGARYQGSEQRADVDHCYDGSPDHRDADLISCWFIKGASYLRDTAHRLAFVTTNSVCQGDHVAILWPRVLSKGLEIYYAHTSFKWTNSAKNNAGVTCAIVGLRRASSASKWIYSDGIRVSVPNINPYLAQGSNTVIGRRDAPLSKVPGAVLGSMARDGGHLIMKTAEKEELLSAYPQARPIVRKLIGSEEFLYSEPRWCLWISDSQLALAKSIPPVAKRIAAVLAFRKASTAKTTNGYASIPHQFAQRAHRDGTSIILPRVSSERRRYIPFGVLDSDSIVSDAGSVVYGAALDVFAVLSSRMHLAWVRAVAGRLEDRIRYSSSICYNNFPFPPLDEEQRKRLVHHAETVLLTRERFPDKTIADLYDPDEMPADLLAAHQALDAEVERCYQPKPFTSDEQRLAHLFALYEHMAAIELAAAEPLLAAQKKSRLRSSSPSEPPPMPDLLKVTYATTGASTASNAQGMREMQARAYAKRDAQYLLLKAPPASGKSRALMFVALDKLYNQGREKVDRRGARAVDRRVVRQHDAHRARLLRRLGGQAASTTSAPRVLDQGKVGAVHRLPGRARRGADLHPRDAAVRVREDRRPTRSTALSLAIDEFHHVSADIRGQPARGAAARRDERLGRAHRRDDGLVLPRRLHAGARARGRGPVHAGHLQLLRPAQRLRAPASRSVSATTSTRAATPTPSARSSTWTRRRSSTSRT